MKTAAALLAAALLAAPLAGCGGGGAEPGAPRRATLVLDFQPNAAHAGIYAAAKEGFLDRAGVALTIQQPSASTDAPKLLEAGRADFAVMDIHDLAIARERGFGIVAVAPIVARPLASVIARDPGRFRRPCDLEGQRAGVTGLPSDDAVLDSVLAADGCDPAGVERVTIGFNAVQSLAAGKVAAATGFWNAEGVALRRQGVPVRIFRVDRFGAPRYPELVLCTSSRLRASDPGLVRALTGAVSAGERFTAAHPGRALADLLGAAPGLDRAEQGAELRALLAARAFAPAGRFRRGVLRAWAAWELAHGIVRRRLDVSAAFPPPPRRGLGS